MTTKHFLLAATVFAGSLGFGGPALADSVSVDVGGGVRVILTDRERETIRSYYHQQQPAPQAKAKALNKGMEKRLAKGKALPPGWQKKMQHGQPIPSDVWAYHEPLPRDVIRRLPPQPDGVITVRIDNQIVRVIAATHVLLDAFDLY